MRPGRRPSSAPISPSSASGRRITARSTVAASASTTCETSFGHRVDHVEGFDARRLSHRPGDVGPVGTVPTSSFGFCSL